MVIRILNDNLKWICTNNEYTANNSETETHETEDKRWNWQKRRKKKTHIRHSPK